MPRWLNWPTGVSPLRAASGVGRLARIGPAGGAGGLFLQVIGLGGGGDAAATATAEAAPARRRRDVFMGLTFGTRHRSDRRRDWNCAGEARVE